MNCVLIKIFGLNFESINDMSMLAFYKKKAELPNLIKIPRPEPEGNEVLIKILRAGICATDMEIAKGYMGDFEGVLGHEFIGVVEKVS